MAMILASVQALQRKHEGIERDLQAIEEKVNSPCRGSGKIVTESPEPGDGDQQKADGAGEQVGSRCEAKPRTDARNWRRAITFIASSLTTQTSPRGFTT
jgi:hypothetical protein